MAADKDQNQPRPNPADELSDPALDQVSGGKSGPVVPTEPGGPILCPIPTRAPSRGPSRLPDAGIARVRRAISTTAGDNLPRHLRRNEGLRSTRPMQARRVSGTERSGRSIHDCYGAGWSGRSVS